MPWKPTKTWWMVCKGRKRWAQNVVTLAAGDVVPLSENVSATVFYPPEDIDVSGDANAVSMLLRIDYGEASALFTGDLEIGGGAGADAGCGRAQGAASRLEQLFQPDASALGLALGGDHLRGAGTIAYGHPAEALLERLEGTGARVFRTDECGAITARLYEDGGVSISTYLLPEDEA